MFISTKPERVPCVFALPCLALLGLTLSACSDGILSIDSQSTEDGPPIARSFEYSSDRQPVHQLAPGTAPVERTHATTQARYPDGSSLRTCRSHYQKWWRPHPTSPVRRRNGRVNTVTVQTERCSSMVSRYILTTIFSGVLLFSFASCDSADIADPSTPQKAALPLQTNSSEFIQARKQLDVSLIPKSIDDIFVKLADRFDGFGGVYENEEGKLVLVSRQPEHTRVVQAEIVAELSDLIEMDDRSRNAYSGKGILIQPATYSFTELAVYRDIIEKNLWDDIPLVLTDVNERQNAVVIGLGESAGISSDDVIPMMAGLGIPLEAIAIEKLPVPQRAVGMSPDLEPATRTVQTQQITDYVRPLAGGLKIDRNGGCTLGIPVWYGNPGNQTRGFLTASHCTGFVGINNGSQWGQPLLRDSIGVEFEDLPLTDCDTTPYLCLSDASLIDLNPGHDDASITLPGHVYLTDFSSSTGPGGYAVASTLTLGVQSPLMGLDVNKVGVRTGWTTGEITGTCVNITLSAGQVRHPDGTSPPTRLSCYIRADTPVNSGDSGSALFHIVFDPSPDGGNLLGILSACSGCDPKVTSQTGIGYYVSWSNINQAMIQHITMFEDQGGL